MQRLALLVLAATALATIGASSTAKDDQDSATYVAPYAEGSQGGDDFNVIHRGEDGRMAIGRAYPVVSVLNCDAQGGYTNYRISHVAAEPIDSVEVTFSDAAVDPYTFVVLNVTDASGAIIGSHGQNGPIVNAGSFEVPVTWDDSAPMPNEVTIEFGLSMTSACPSADVGMIMFESVSVNVDPH